MSIPCTGDDDGIAHLVLGLQITDKDSNPIKGSPMKIRLTKKCNQFGKSYNIIITITLELFTVNQEHDITWWFCYWRYLTKTTAAFDEVRTKNLQTTVQTLPRCPSNESGDAVVIVHDDDEDKDDDCFTRYLRRLKIRRDNLGTSDDFDICVKCCSVRETLVQLYFQRQRICASLRVRTMVGVTNLGDANAHRAFMASSVKRVRQ